MKSIFLSYRREDSEHQTGRLYEHLANRFGRQRIFKDVDSLTHGSHFPEVLSERIAACDIFLAIIGDRWLTVQDTTGNRRLDDPDDFVRMEIEAALNREVLVIPVLVGASSMPSAKVLPANLRKLTDRTATRVRPDPDFRNDTKRLIRGFKPGLKLHRKRTNPPQPSKPPRRLGVAVAFLSLAILLGIIYVATDKGQIKIEVDDPTAIVIVDGQKVRIEGVGEPITLRVGLHDLIVERGNVKVETRKFVVNRGDNPVLKITLNPNDDTTVGQKRDEPLITDTIGMKLKLIPTGEFFMGSADGELEAQPDEKPQRKVQITRPFYLGINEVSQAEYRAVVGSNPSWFSSTGGGKDKVAAMNTDRFPVECVSWLDAVTFCNKLSEREGFKPCYTTTGEVIATGTGYRLPTEAEWEYACRAVAEATTTKTPPFSFGAMLSPTDANFDGNYTYNGSAKGTHQQRTALVGSYQPNAFGLYDMHGNVWEWCQDGYAAGDPQPASRVGRGGGWSSSPLYCRSAYHFRDSPDYRSYFTGFRVARVQ